MEGATAQAHLSTATRSPIPPTATIIPPTATAAANRMPLRLIASPTAIRATPTQAYSGFSLTATQLANDLTQTANYYQSPTTRPPSPTYTPTPSPTPTMTPNWNATATAYVAQATQTAEILSTPVTHYADSASGLTFDVPEGWQAPQMISAHAIYLTDGIAKIFVYSGNAAYFESYIPTDITDLNAAAEAVSQQMNAPIVPSNVEGAARIVPAAKDGRQGEIYLFAPDGGWLLISLNAPTADYDTYRKMCLRRSWTRLCCRAKRTLPPPTATLTLRSNSDTTAPVVLKPYTGSKVDIAFVVPAGWIEWVSEDMSMAEAGVWGAAFSEKEEDVNIVGSQSGLILSVIRYDTTLNPDLDMAYETPDALLEEMVTETNNQEVISPVTFLSDSPYPAAGVILEYPDFSAVFYAVKLDQNNWALVTLSGPPHSDLLPLDEPMMHAIIRSIRWRDFSDQLSATPPEPTAAPTAAATATLPLPTVTLTPTHCACCPQAVYRQQD